MAPGDYVRLNPQTPDKQGYTFEPLKDAGKEKPKEIFAGMKMLDALNYGLMDEFNAANTDKNDVISEEEFQKYDDDKKGITRGKKEGRVATNGVYEIKKGDTIQKIADDFGVDAQMLRKINKAYLESHNNIICVGDRFYIDPAKLPDEIKESIITSSDSKTQEAKKQKQAAGMSKILSNVVVPEKLKVELQKLTGKDCSNISAEEIFNDMMKDSLGGLQDKIAKLMASDDSGEIKKFCSDMRAQIMLGSKKNVISVDYSENLTIISSVLDGNEGVLNTVCEAFGIDEKALKGMTLDQLCDKLSSLDDKGRLAIERAILQASGDPEISLYDKTYSPENDPIENISKYINYEGKVKDANGNFTKEFMKALCDKIDADLDLNNSESKINKYLEDIKSGNFTKKEIEFLKNNFSGIFNEDGSYDINRLSECVLDKFSEKDIALLRENKVDVFDEDGSVDPNKLANFVLENMARSRVEQAYAKATLDIDLNQIKLNRNRKEIKLLSTEAIERIESNSSLDKKSAKRVGLVSGIVVGAPAPVVDLLDKFLGVVTEDNSVSKEVKQTVANDRVELDNYISDGESSDSDKTVAIAVAEYADEKHVRAYVEKHPEKIDFMEEVIEVLASNNTDPERQEIYQNIQNTIAEIKQEIAETGSYSGGSASGSGVAVGGGSTGAISGGSAGTSSYSTAAAYNNQESVEINDIRSASADYYTARGVVTNPIANENKVESHRSANRIGTELSTIEPLRYTPDKIRKIVQDMNNVVRDFDSLTQEEQTKVKLYLNSAPPHALISMLTSGSEEVQKFLLQHNYISIEGIAHTVTVDDIESFIDPIQEKLAEYVQSRIDAGTLQEDQMTSVQKKMLGYYERNNVR